MYQVRCNSLVILDFVCIVQISGIVLTKLTTVVLMYTVNVHLKVVTLESVTAYTTGTHY